MKNELQLIAMKELNHYDDMYKIVDFLNKNLSKMDLVFGLTEKEGKNVLTIYKET